MSAIAERGPTPRTEAWLEQLRTALDAEHGRRVELARFLAGGNEAHVPSRKVQLARVLNQGRQPEPEFVLATLEWLNSRSLGKAAGKGRAPKRRTDT